MASTRATDKQLEFLRWKRRQDRVRAQQAAARVAAAAAAPPTTQQQHMELRRNAKQQQPLASRRYPQEQHTYAAAPARGARPVHARRPPQSLDHHALFYHGADKRSHDAFDADELFDGSDSAFADAEPSPSSQQTAPERETDYHDDTDEDELMRMIMEREQQEEHAAAAANAAPPPATRAPSSNTRFHVAPPPPPSSSTTTDTRYISDDFYSPVRPADSDHTEHAEHAPFRLGRVVTPTAKQPQRRPTKLVNFHARPTRAPADPSRRKPRDERLSRKSNQVEHEQQPTRLRSVDDVWDHFLSGASSESAPVSPRLDPSARDRRPSARPPPMQTDVSTTRANIFREGISLSTPLDDDRSSAPASVETFGARRGPSQQTQQSRNYSNESIPTVSYSPPMSPATASSLQQRTVNNSAPSHPCSGAPASGNGDDPLDPHRYSLDHAVDSAQHPPRHDESSHAVFPFWSLVFLVSCAVVGTSGFFMDDVLDALGSVSTRASALTLAKHEQAAMHARLEELQRELHGFRSTASEIEAHSQRVFDEVQTHLSRMKREREKHQAVIATEMHDLRASMLHMMQDMVEHERSLIHSRLVHAAAAPVDASEPSVVDSEHPTASSTSGASQEPAPVTVAVEHQPLDQRVPESHSPPLDAAVASVPVDNGSVAALAQPRVAAPLSRGESMMLLSWELLLMLTAMSILGAFVGVRVRNINRRKRWFEQRHARQQLQAQLERERAMRLGEDSDDSEDNQSTEDSDATESGDDRSSTRGDESDNSSAAGDTNSEGEWDDTATESSGVETVSLMRGASGESPRRVRLRAVSTDAEDEGGAGGESGNDGGKRESSTRTRGATQQPEDGATPAKKAVRYSFIDESPSRRRSPRLERRVQQQRRSET